MKNTPKKVQPTVKVVLKKYVKPALTIYGKLSEFTAGGLTGSAEGSMASNPNMA